MASENENKARFEEGFKLVCRQIPGFQIRYKNKSWSSKVLGVLVWLFNRRYMTEFTTTRYPRVYFPSQEYVEENYSRAFKILMHEFVHLWDRRQQGIWHNISYALPQLLALPFLIALIATAIWLPWPWIVTSGALTLLFASPLPAYWRMKAELRGYTMNMAVNYWRYGFVHAVTINWIIKRFTEWDYFRMWPFKDDIGKRIAYAVHDIEKDYLTPPFLDVQRIM